MSQEYPELQSIPTNPVVDNGFTANPDLVSEVDSAFEDARAEIDNFFRNNNAPHFLKYPRSVASLAEQAVKPNPVSEKVLRLADSLSAARDQKMREQFLTHIDHRAGFINALASRLFRQDYKVTKLVPLTEEILIAKESEIGGKIFGKTPDNVIYKFWNHGRGDWFFYQVVMDEYRSKVKESLTIHYDVKPNMVLKSTSKDGAPCEVLDGAELDNFSTVTKLYHDRVISGLYSDKTTSADIIGLQNHSLSEDPRKAA